MVAPCGTTSSHLSSPCGVESHWPIHTIETQGKKEHRLLKFQYTPDPKERNVDTHISLQV